MTAWRHILSWDTDLPEVGSRVRMLEVGVGYRSWGSEETKFVVPAGGEGNIVGGVSRFGPWLSVIWDDYRDRGEVYVQKNTVLIL